MEAVIEKDVVTDSSPAAPDVPVTPAAPRALKDFTPEEMTEWRKTGNRPQDSAEADPLLEATASPTSTDVPPQSDSAPAKPRNKTEERIQTLLADRKKEKDRADTLERELSTLRTQPAPPVTAVSTTTVPAGLVKPNPNDTAKYPLAQYDPQFQEDNTAYNVQLALANERAKATEEQQRVSVQQEWSKTTTAFKERCEAVAKEIPDFEAVALKSESVVPRGTTIDLAIWEDEHGPRVLYHLQKNPAEVARILKLSVWNQTKEIVRLSDKLAAKPASSSTQAPPPPNALPTRGAPGDAIVSAVKGRNFDAYRDEANAREMTTRRGVRK